MDDGYIHSFRQNYKKWQGDGTKFRIIGLSGENEDINGEKHAGGFKDTGYILVRNLGASTRVFTVVFWTVHLWYIFFSLYYIYLTSVNTSYILMYVCVYVSDTCQISKCFVRKKWVTCHLPGEEIQAVCRLFRGNIPRCSMQKIIEQCLQITEVLMKGTVVILH